MRITLCLILISGAISVTTAKARSVELEKIEFSPGTEDVYTLDYEIETVNATTFTFKGTYDQKVDLDSTWTVELIVSMVDRLGTAYQIYRKEPTSVCDLLSEVSGMYMPTFADDSPAFDPNTCPIPKGTYQIDREVVNLEELSNKAIPGLFKLDIQFAQDGVIKANTLVYMRIK